MYNWKLFYWTICLNKLFVIVKVDKQNYRERHLSLTRAALHNTAKSRPCYLHIMHKCQYRHMNKHSNFLQRVKLTCNSNGILLHKYLFNKSYARKCKLRFKCNVADGIADSIYTLLLHLWWSQFTIFNSLIAKAILISHYLCIWYPTMLALIIYI